MEKDPILEFEKITKGVNDKIGKITQPVLGRYPLLFAFLVTFSLAAIIRGFEVFTDQMEIFEKHPTLLILAGSIVLLFTGSLYKTLEKKEN